MEHLDRKDLLAAAGVGAAGIVVAPSALASGDGRRARHAIQGTWLAVIKGTSPDGSTFDAQGIGAYLPGGVAIELASIFPTTSLGVWRGRSGRRFHVTFRRFLFGPTGAPAGAGLIHVEGRVDADHDSWSGTGYAELLDPAGNAGPRTLAVLHGTRMRVD